MYFSYRYTCNVCGDQKDLATDSDDGGRCHSCNEGRYFRSGECYDQEWIEQQKYEERQDREYAERHRYERS